MWVRPGYACVWRERAVLSWTETAGVSCSGCIKEVEDSSDGRSDCERGYGDGWADSVHNTHSLQRVHSADSGSLTGHCDGLRPSTCSRRGKSAGVWETVSAAGGKWRGRINHDEAKSLWWDVVSYWGVKCAGSLQRSKAKLHELHSMRGYLLISEIKNLNLRIK